MTFENMPQHPYAQRPSLTAERLQHFLSTRGLENQKILEMGCGTGRNTQYLGFLGHAVLGFALDIEEVKLASEYDFSARSAYVVCDSRRPPLKEQFDAVLISEMLHMMPKSGSILTLKNARTSTKPGGLNAVSGYLLTDDVQLPKHREQCLNGNELLQSYTNMGWDILDYDETVKPVSYFRGQERISSVATIVAQKPR